MTGWDSKFDLQLLSWCAMVNNFRDIHQRVSGTLPIMLCFRLLCVTVLTSNVYDCVCVCACVCVCVCVCVCDSFVLFSAIEHV